MTEWIVAKEAAQRLGVKRATLYTYVSRGLLARRRSGAESLFARDEIDALARERRHPSAPSNVLKMRSIRSAVSDVRDGELFLRGVALADLADEPHEDVVDMLLGPGPTAAIDMCDHVLGLPLNRRLPALALWADDPGVEITPEVVATAARGLLAAAPRVYGGQAGTGAEALFAALARRKGSAAEVATLNTALVSLTDHGLAASVVAARVAASTRASAYSSFVAGYAALSGRLHGGIVPAAVTALGNGMGQTDDGRAPGFGHWRHPHGDPRADAILARLARVETAAPVLTRLGEMAHRLDRQPNIDGALAALILACDLPVETGEICFQVGRTAGLAAHVIEELSEEPLRWRAKDPDT